MIVPVSGISQRIGATADRIALIISPGRVSQGIRPAAGYFAFTVPTGCVLQRICATSCLRKAIEWYNDENE